MKFRVTIGVKNTGYYTHLLYILLTVMEIFTTILFVLSLIFFELGFTPCKAKQPLQGMECYKKKMHKKIKAYRKSL